tara:strand:+ start:2056 stop:2427 length:372 start_codon:yes stop_codon:yes gene_type:complete
MLKIFFIATGGALGSLARYFVATGPLKNFIFFDIPVAIISVNILGSFFFGIILGLIQSNFIVSENIKIFILSGFLAAFTTFSTFAWESVSLIQQEMYIKLVIYCLASITLSILFCLYGYNLGK